MPRRCDSERESGLRFCNLGAMSAANSSHRLYNHCFCENNKIEPSSRRSGLIPCGSLASLQPSRKFAGQDAARGGQSSTTTKTMETLGSSGKALGSSGRSFGGSGAPVAAPECPRGVW
jgi:hypothetical protein